MDTTVLDAATDHFSRVIAQVDDARWGDPSPCPGWTAGDVADHVTGGSRWAVRLLAGEGGPDALGRIRDEPLGVDRVAEFAAAAAAQREAFAAAVPEGTVDHTAGPMPPARFLVMRINDLLLHGWDLARAAGIDDTIPPGLVEASLVALEPMAEGLAASGMFAPRIPEPREPGSRQDHLLRLVGRQP